VNRNQVREDEEDEVEEEVDVDERAEVKNDDDGGGEVNVDFGAALHGIDEDGVARLNVTNRL